MIFLNQVRVWSKGRAEGGVGLAGLASPRARRLGRGSRPGRWLGGQDEDDAEPDAPGVLLGRGTFALGEAVVSSRKPMPRNQEPGAGVQGDRTFPPAGSSFSEVATSGLAGGGAVVAGRKPNHFDGPVEAAVELVPINSRKGESAAFPDPAPSESPIGPETDQKGAAGQAGAAWGGWGGLGGWLQGTLLGPNAVGTVGAAVGEVVGDDIGLEKVDLFFSVIFCTHMRILVL